MNEFKTINEWEVSTPNGWESFKGIRKLQKNSFCKLTFDDDTILICSENHKLKTTGGNFEYVRDLKNETIIGDERNKTIKSIQKINKKIDLYDLINVGNNHEYYTNSVLSSNCAFIEKAEEIWVSSQPTLSLGGKCIILSTPNGVSNFFHKMWTQAEEGSSKFNPIKLPWNLHPERDENWRKEQDRVSENLKKTAQELDCDFLSSGTTVIDLVLLDWFKNTYMKDPIEKRGVDQGYWIWQYPAYTPDANYVVCADPARGDGEDYSAFHVLNVKTMEQCAEYKGHIPTKEYGNMLVSVATDYNNALLIVEREGPGWAVLQQIIDRGYPNTFYGSTDLKYVDVEQQMTNKYYAEEKKLAPGFATTLRTRPVIISNMCQYFVDKSITLYSKRIYSELEVFIWENHKAQAARGYNDDLVMSLAIGLWVRDTAIRLQHERLDLTRATLNQIVVKKPDASPVYKSQHHHASETWKMNIGRRSSFGGKPEDLKWLL